MPENKRHGRLSKHIELKEDNWSLGSKKKLINSVRHKMKRIFAESLDALDKELANGNIDRKAFKRVRSRILNIGNDQIRNMEMELEQRYNVEWLNYHVEFKVIPGPELEEMPFKA